MFKKVLAFLAVSLLVFGLDEGCDPGAAFADTACPAGYICFYDNADGTGFLAWASVTGHTKTVCYQLSTASRNKASYIQNNTTSTWVVYDGASCETTPGVIYPLSRGAMDSAFNNDITSYFRET